MYAPALTEKQKSWVSICAVTPKSFANRFNQTVLICMGP
ncbi:hypothetical protein ISE1_2734 [plant metagenome]|uniref:Uncharacterized protein n=1 Tax=plant metagenome TaxID=1297885 RepID=A0A484UI74_9ZZZZ